MRKSEIVPKGRRRAIGDVPDARRLGGLQHVTRQVFVGGNFNAAGGAARDRVAAVDTGAGNALAWNPGTDSQVDALALVGPTVYLAGGFTTVGALPRANLAAVNALTGATLAWNPGPDNITLGLTVSGFPEEDGGEAESRGAAIGRMVQLPLF